MEALVSESGPPKSAVVKRNVRAEIARSGKTHQSVARGIDMPYPTFRRRIAGEVDWRAGELEAVARYLGITVSRLTEEPRP